MVSGVYVRLAPEPDNTPCDGPDTTTNVNTSPSPSLPDNTTPTATSSSVDTDFESATGTWLTGVPDDQMMVADRDSAPRLTVTVSVPALRPAQQTLPTPDVSVKTNPVAGLGPTIAKSSLASTIPTPSPSVTVALTHPSTPTANDCDDGLTVRSVTAPTLASWKPPG